MITAWITPTMAPWMSRPAMSEPRLAGETRKRSTTPRSMSSMRPMPLQPAEKRQVITTMPGVRKSMYELAPNPGISTILRNRAP